MSNSLLTFTVSVSSIIVDVFMAKPHMSALPVGICARVGANIAPRVGTLYAVVLKIVLLMLTMCLVTKGHKGKGVGSRRWASQIGGSRGGL